MKYMQKYMQQRVQTRNDTAEPTRGRRMAGLRTLLVVAAAAILSPSVGFGQTFNQPGDVEAQGAHYHVFSRPGEPTIQVFVLGSLPSTGVFEVGVETDMSQLLALAGGVTLGERSTRERHTVTVRLHRREGGERRLLYEALLSEMLAQPGGHPELQDGDVFEVDTIVHTRANWIDAVRTIASFTTFALAIERVIVRTR